MRASPPESPTSWPCLRLEGKGTAQRVVLDFSVSPNAKRTELVGWHDGALRLRLAAPPVDGAANDALRKWLAGELGLPQSRVMLLRGASGRRKQWAVDMPPADVVAWLGQQSALRE
ncbi:MAG TPA: DUF167 domain-containing protein [Aquabacterium sp.]|nr:DUF167 domain-containing protein [Aquabacterium sp.]